MTVRKVLGATAAAGAALYIGFLVLLYFSQRIILYPGVNDRVEAVPPRAPGLEVLKIATSAGDVEALFLPAIIDSAHRPTMIFAHGNGEVTDYWVSAFEGFRRRGIGVLLVEYPGYGRSTGSPSEQAIRLGMDAATIS